MLLGDSLENICTRVKHHEGVLHIFYIVSLLDLANQPICIIE